MNLRVFYLTRRGISDGYYFVVIVVGQKKMCIAKDRIHIFFCCLKEHSLKTE